MATKEAIFKLRVDTGNSVADINAADKAIQEFNKDLQQTKTIQSDSKSSDNFAAKLAAIDQKVQTGGLGIRELSRVIREYQSVAIAAGEESVVGREAIEQAGKLKDRIGDLQSQTKVASSDFKRLDLAIAGIGTGAAVFQGLSGAIALTGVENESLTKTMVKLQAAQGVANAVNQVALALNSDAVLGIQLRIAIEKVKNFVMKDSAAAAVQGAAGETALSGANTAVGASATFAAGAMKILKVALITSGVGALVVGIGFLIESMGLFSSKSEDAEKSQKKLDAALEKTNETIERQKTLYDESQGIVDRQTKQNIINATKAGASEKELLKIKTDGAKQTIGLFADQEREASRLYMKYSKSGSTKQFETAEKAWKEASIKLSEAQLDFDLEEAERNKKKTVTKKENNKVEVDIEKEKADKIRSIFLRELEAIESGEDLKISMMQDGKAKQLAILDETYGDFRNDLIKKANENEIKALDEKLNNGKINEQQYRDELKLIMETGTKNFNDSENSLMNLATDKLNEDKRRLGLSAQELEIDDINKAFDQKDITEVERLTKIQEINDKYSKIDKDKAAKNETEKRNTAKLLNDISLSDQENALANLEFEDQDSKKKLLEMLNSTNQNELITQEQYDLALIELEKKKQKKIEQIKEKAAESAKAIAQQKFEDDSKQVNEIIEGAQKALDFANEINNLINQAADLQIQENNNKRDQDFANLEIAQQKELSVVGLNSDQKAAIEQKFAMAKYIVQKKAFETEDKLNRAKFNRDKALQMTQIVISTAGAVMKAIASAGGVPIGIPMGIATGIIGAAQLAVVAATKYQSGAAPQMPSISGGGGSTGGTGEQFAPITPAVTTATAGLIGNGSKSSTTNQVFVLESDISKVQNNVMVAEQKSKF